MFPLEAWPGEEYNVIHLKWPSLQVADIDHRKFLGYTVSLFSFR